MQTKTFSVKDGSVIFCIIYPKGKRPDLGYPVNNKKEEK